MRRSAHGDLRPKVYGLHELKSLAPVPGPTLIRAGDGYCLIPDVGEACGGVRNLHIGWVTACGEGFCGAIPGPWRVFLRMAMYDARSMRACSGLPSVAPTRW